MGSARTFWILMSLAAALLVTTLGPGLSRAASTVDVSYDLSDTTLVWDIRSGKLPVDNEDFSVNGTISGSMKVQYASDSSSGMPILHDNATLQTFNLTVESLALQRGIKGGKTITGTVYLTGTLHWQLTSPVAGNLTSNGMLTGLNVNLLMTGRADCPFPLPSYCAYFVGLPTFTVYPSYSRSGAISVAGTVGPYGGADYTRHTLTGRAPAIGWQPGAGVIGLGYDFWDLDDRGGAFIVGREVVRTAAGHGTRIVPEPGTLLLLGAGTAGLAVVGCATRRKR